MRTMLRSKATLLFMTLGLLVAIPAVALASDVVSDVNADLSSDVNQPTQVHPNTANNAFKIKVWATGNFNNINDRPGTVEAVKNYSTTLNAQNQWVITAGSSAADKETLNFKDALRTAGFTGNSFNYTPGNDCPADTAINQGTGHKGCKTNPFVVNANLSVGNVPVNTNLTVTNALTGSSALEVITNSTSNRYSLDSGFVRVVAPPVTNTAPQVSVDGVTNGASYEIGSVPNATCKVTDTEDGNSSFDATLSAITGSLAAYKLGSQTASCSYTDEGGLEGSDSATYTIQDTGDPVITDLGPTAAANSNGWYTSAVTSTFQAEDFDADGNAGAGFAGEANPYTFTQSSGANEEGSSVTINSGKVSDVAGNESNNASSGPFKIDLSDPTNIQFVGGPAANSSHAYGNVPAAPTCTADDAISGPPSCVVTGYSANVGTHTLTAKATDNAGRTATATRTYTVNPWNATGFYSPVGTGNSEFLVAPGTLPAVNNTGVWNTVKGGSTVPLKFNVYVGGTEKTSTSGLELKAQQLSKCASDGTAQGDAVDFTTTDTTSLRYSGTPGVDGQFIQNWKTPKVTGETCYRTAVTFADGSSIYGFFKLLR